MQISFVLMLVSPRLEYEVFNKLLKIHEIIDLHPLFGEYNLMTKIEALDYKNVGEIWNPVDDQL